MPWSNQPFPSKRTEPSELELRRQVDRAICRALIDHAYAVALLANPGLAVEASDTTASEQWLELQAIDASSLRDFARQALEVFS